MRLAVFLAWFCATFALAEPPQFRVATYNASLNRNSQGQLVTDLSVTTNTQARRVAEIIQRVAPDIVLINEFDVDPANPTQARELFHTNYLGVSQNGQAALSYPYRYSALSNTGVASGFDLDNNCFANTTIPASSDTTTVKDRYGNDCFGFGWFPGQYSFVVYSKYPIQTSAIRTFQLFKWKDMPGAVLPDNASTPTPADWYSTAELNVFRLSSKNHLDLPIEVAPGKVVHLLASHPTPPSFDGAEDRNGRRNHDEIRFWADYLNNAAYIYDDAGATGGLLPTPAPRRFVVLGDLNADPLDGDSYQVAVQQLRNHPLVDSTPNPSSPGGTQQAALQGGNNVGQQGNAAYDTADFGDGGSSPGNLRVDHVLPSKAGLEPVGSGVFWPLNTDPNFPLVSASDHRLVWMDLQVTDPVTITKPPTAQTVNPGATVNLSAEATGTGPFTYQWRKNTQNLADQTGATLSFSATESSEGSYDVIVSNVDGPVTSAAAAILVNDPVVIAEQPTGVTINPMAEVRLRVTASGTGPLSYQWRRDEEPIDGANAAELVFNAVEGDEGLYDVVITNIVGSETSDAVQVMVNDPATISTQPESVTVNPNTAVSFTVSATGTPPLAYQWFKGDEALTDATGAVLSLNANEAAEGSYRVRVSNGVNTVFSDPATLTVNDPVFIADHPRSKAVKLGGTVQFTVAATGTAPIAYQWRRNQQLIGETGPTLTVSPVEAGDLGTYDVVVSNVVGAVTSNPAQLKVVDWTTSSGTYQGPLRSLPQPAAPGEAFAGRVTAAVSKTGKVTGKVDLFGKTAPFSTELDLQLEASLLVEPRNAPAVDLRVALDPILGAIRFTATRDVAPTTPTQGSAPQIPKYTKTKLPPRMGRYTLALSPGDGAPSGMEASGYLALNLAPSGVITWAGKLPDATPVKGSSWITPARATVLYTSLYYQKPELAGHLAGPVEFTFATQNGIFSWRKPLQSKATSWPGPLSMNLAAQGSVYNPPGRDEVAIPLAIFDFELTGPNGAFTSKLAFTERNELLFEFPNLHRFQLRLKKTTGELSGSYRDATNRTRKLHGILLQAQQSSSGLAVDSPELSGWSFSRP